jgi:hypothetical protein
MGKQSISHTNNTYIEGEVINPPTVLDVLAQKSIANPDTLYLWQARKEPDFLKFMEAMQKEIDDHTKGGHWKIMKQRYGA